MSLPLLTRILLVAAKLDDVADALIEDRETEAKVLQANAEELGKVADEIKRGHSITINFVGDMMYARCTCGWKTTGTGPVGWTRADRKIDAHLLGLK